MNAFAESYSSSSFDVIIGLASAFESNTGDTYMKFPLYDVDTDRNGVTAVTDW